MTHAPALLRLAVMLTGDRSDAEDLLQSTLLKSVRHGDRIARMDAPAAYLRKTMLNEHLSQGRRAGRRVRTDPEPDGGSEARASSSSEAADQRDEVWRWLAELSVMQRSVLALRYYEDLPDREIAELLGCAEATVRSHAARGLAALRPSHEADRGSGDLMSTWTDEELARLVTDTFRRHESLADPDAATDIARTVPEGLLRRRSHPDWTRWLLLRSSGATGSEAPGRRRHWGSYGAAAASVALAIIGVTWAVSHHHPTDAVASGPRYQAPPPSHRTYAENRAVAAAESARVAELVPVPAGSTHLRARPLDWPAGGHAVGPADGSLGRDSWWSVRGPRMRYESYLRVHLPRGMTTDDGLGDTSDMQYAVYGEDSRMPTAYPGVELLVEWHHIGNRTLVHGVTFTQAYQVRSPPSYVTGTVPLVVIVRNTASTFSEPRFSTTRLTDPGDRREIAQLVKRVNGVPRQAEFVNLMSCPRSVAEAPPTTVTFHTDQGVLSLDEFACPARVGVLRDGQKLPDTLVPDRLDRLVDTVASAHSTSGETSDR